MYILGWMTAILIELIVLKNSSSFFGLGIVVITFGLMFWSCMRHGDAANKKAVIMMIIYCLIWGGLLLLAPLVEENTSIGRRYGEYVVQYGIGTVFLSLGICTGIEAYKEAKSMDRSRKISGWSILMIGLGIIIYMLDL